MASVRRTTGWIPETTATIEALGLRSLPTATIAQQMQECARAHPRDTARGPPLAPGCRTHDHTIQLETPRLTPYPPGPRNTGHQHGKALAAGTPQGASVTVCYCVPLRTPAESSQLTHA